MKAQRTWTAGAADLGRVATWLLIAAAALCAGCAVEVGEPIQLDEATMADQAEDGWRVEGAVYDLDDAREVELTHATTHVEQLREEPESLGLMDASQGATEGDDENPDPTPWKLMGSGNPDPTPWAEEDEGTQDNGNDQVSDPDPQPW